MTENKKQVTIDVAYFVELYNAANNDGRYKTLEAAYNQVRNERDEIRHQFQIKEEQCKECAAVTALELRCKELEKERDELNANLVSAKRCIEDVYNENKPRQYNEILARVAIRTLEIIDAYHEQKEAK